jgi:transcriptional regulator with XRE-family HTH domain
MNTTFPQKTRQSERKHRVNINTADVTHQGQVITQYRKAKRWSQEDLAEALQVDVRTVQRMEKQAMIKNISRRQLLIGLLGIPAALMELENELLHQTLKIPLVLNKDRMSFLEDEMSTRWELYYTGGTLRAARGLDMWIDEVTQLAKSSQETAWHKRTLALLTMSYQLQSCILRDSMEYTQAHFANRRAYHIAKELDDPELIASALSREGITLIQQEKPTDAIKYLQGALKTIHYLGLPTLKAYTLQGLSEAYAKAQQTQECWQSIGQLEHILEQGEHITEERSNTRLNTASVTAQKGINAVLLHDHQRALALMDKSLSTYDPAFIRGRARLLSQKAEAYYGLGYIDESATIAEEALRLARSVGANKTLARVRTLHTTLLQSPWRKERSIARLGAVLSL